MAISKNCEIFQFLQAKDVNIDKLIHLENKCFNNYYKKHRFNEADFTYYIRRKQSIFFVATLNSSLVGYVAGMLKKTGAELLVSLDSIAVLPLSQREGIGDKLMRHFIKEVKHLGCKKITLAAAVANKGGVLFFSRQGFKKVRSLPAYYDEGVDGVLMKLSL
jgi:ribosomal-protein-alanine N-acetyltransferase